MVEITSTTDEDQRIRPEAQELYMWHNWHPEAIDRFVVGRIHGAYDLTESRIHLSIAYDDFGDITYDELRRFWNDVLPKTNVFQRWSSKTPDDVEVKKVLEDINKTVMDDAQIYFEAHYNPDFDYPIEFYLLGIQYLFP